MKEFKFFQKNCFKNKCRLQAGSSFVYHGYYCIVTRMHQNGFLYLIQELEYINYMSYEEYLTTPSAAGRQLNR
jgi:hypothetical protein